MSTTQQIHTLEALKKLHENLVELKAALLVLAIKTILKSIQEKRPEGVTLH